jgi:hypothetical protein
MKMLNECRYAIGRVATMDTSKATKEILDCDKYPSGDSRVLPSSRGRVVANQEIEAKTV